ILEFSPDSRSLAIVTDDGNGAQIDLWDLAAKEPKRTLTDHDAGITAIAFSRDGRLLASGDLHNGRGTVIIRDLTTNAQPRLQKPVERQRDVLLFWTKSSHACAARQSLPVLNRKRTGH